MPFNNGGYNNRPQNFNNGGNNYQRNGPRVPGANQGAPQQNYYNNNRAKQPPVPIVPQQMVPVQPTNVPFAQPAVIIRDQAGLNAPLPNPDPLVNNYNQRGFGYLPAIVPESNYKPLVGEFIYEYVEKLVGEQRAPKITGMLIDLPIDEIKAYLYDFSKLYQKIGDAVNLLNQLQTQGQ